MILAMQLTGEITQSTSIYDEGIQNRIREMFDVMLKDDEKGKEQDANGIYRRRNLKCLPKIMIQLLMRFQRYMI